MLYRKATPKQLAHLRKLRESEKNSARRGVMASIEKSRAMSIPITLPKINAPTLEEIERKYADIT